MSDVVEHMLRRAPALSNAERQRQFQASHPGYDRRRKARQRASSKRGAAQRLAALLAQAAEANAAETAPAPPVTLIPALTRLALPAPVVDPILAELDRLRDRLAAARDREALPAQHPTSAANAQSRPA